jgi:signal transduction histidine kinase
MSLRARLLVVSLLSLTVGLGALLVVGNVLLNARVHAEATSLLRARAEAQVAALTVTPGGVRVRQTPNENVLDRQSWVLDRGRVVERPGNASPALDHAAIALGRAGRSAEVDGPSDIRLRAAAVPGRGRAIVVVGLSVVTLERLQHEVALGSIVLAALILLAAGLATRGAVDGALAPVAQMTASAEDWGAHDLDRRFALGAPSDELTGLAATLDGLLGRIAASRRHEQRFASEVAHELRTPVAGLRARAELALSARGAGAEAEREDALRAVIADAARLDREIDALVAVARRELDPSSGVVDLAALAREVDGATVTVPAVLPPAEGEPEIVRRALAPLVENARRHARSAVTLELTHAAGSVRLAVRDDGPGLDPAIGEDAFEPGVRGADAGDGGAGLGLALARRLARSCGGDVRIGPGPGGCFVLELPAIDPRG